jgi:hypothetical protein
MTSFTKGYITEFLTDVIYKEIVTLTARISERGEKSMLAVWVRVLYLCLYLFISPA